MVKKTRLIFANRLPHTRPGSSPKPKNEPYPVKNPLNTFFRVPGSKKNPALFFTSSAKAEYKKRKDKYALLQPPDHRKNPAI